MSIRTNALLVVALLLPGGTRNAGAQLAVDQLELTITPQGRDSTGATVFTVMNEGTKAERASLHFEDWDRTLEGENHFYPVGKLGPRSCGATLQVFPQTIQLPPKASAQVRVTYSGARTTSCWGIVFIEQSLPRGDAARQLVYVLRTGIKIYVEPQGLTRDGGIDSIAVGPQIAQPGKPDPRPGSQSVVLRFHNSGGVHLDVRGRVEFRSLQNAVVGSVPVPDLPLLPESSRLVSVPVPTLPKGRYLVLALLDYGGVEIAAGQYQIEIQ